MYLTENSIYQVCYKSMPVGDPMLAILDIIRSSELNNRKLHASGMLYFCPFIYLQMIEGPQSNVVKLMDAIRIDSRHRVMWETHRAVLRRSFHTALPMGYLDDSDLRKIKNGKFYQTQINKSSNIEADALVELLVSAGQQKYPSMSYE